MKIVAKILLTVIACLPAVALACVITWRILEVAR